MNKSALRRETCVTISKIVAKAVKSIREADIKSLSTSALDRHIREEIICPLDELRDSLMERFDDDVDWDHSND